MADQDMTKMKVADLRRELKLKGLNTVGNKNELLERLQAALIDGDNLEDGVILDHAEDDELLDEDGLIDDDDDLEDKILDTTNDEMLKSPSDSLNSNSPEEVKKPVSLKRNISITAPSRTSETLTECESEPSKKAVKLTELTAQDRLDMRAKKFGSEMSTPLSGNKALSDKKASRAERFGITTTDKTAAVSKKITNDVAPASLDLLKKRAERFGTVQAPELKKTEQSEKLQKREIRFGSAAAEPNKSSADYAEKARLRAERFKTAA